MHKNTVVLKTIILILIGAITVFSFALVSLYKAVNNNEEIISSLNNQNNNDIDVDEINNKIEDLNKKTDNIINDKGSEDSINNDIKNIKGDVNSLYASNYKNANQNNNLNNEIQQLKNELSSLQKTIDKQQDDIDALKDLNSNQVVGAIVAYAGNDLPNNYLECNGQEVSRSTYADLFSIIGTTYGDGDGSTTFNLPNLQDKFPMSSSTKTMGTYISPGLPNITGTIIETPYPVNPASGGLPTITGAFKNSTIGSSNGWTDGGSGRKPVTTKNFSAADGEVHNDGSGDTYRNDIYGKSDTVQPPALVIKYIIKVKD